MPTRRTPNFRAFDNTARYAAGQAARTRLGRYAYQGTGGVAGAIRARNNALPAIRGNTLPAVRQGATFTVGGAGARRGQRRNPNVVDGKRKTGS